MTLLKAVHGRMRLKYEIALNEVRYQLLVNLKSRCKKYLRAVTHAADV
jgi:hypothetical protein